MARRGSSRYAPGARGPASTPTFLGRATSTTTARPSCFTLGRMRMSQAVRFLNTSLKAEIAVNQAPGLLWATTLARPPFVATCSIWPDADAINAYTFATPGAHPSAVAAGRVEAVPPRRSVRPVPAVRDARVRCTGRTHSAKQSYRSPDRAHIDYRQFVSSFRPRPGGSPASCIRSIRCRLPTRTPTVSVTFAVSSIISITSRGWASTASGSPPSPCRRTRTGATTSPTTARCNPISGRWTTSTSSLRAARERTIHVLLDFVPNHSSNQHPWFVESRSSRTNPKRDWYLWADPEARWLTPEQLVEQLRWPGVEARRSDRPVLHVQSPVVATRPQLVEPRGSRDVRRDHPLLVRPRHRGLSASTSAT